MTRLPEPAGQPDGTGPTPVGAADETAPWRDSARPATERAERLLRLMTLEEKVAQLNGLWVGADAGGGAVAPHQDEIASESVDWDRAIAGGLGQLTRPFGTAPIDPATGRESLARAQREIRAANRFGIPALAHEECLAGFTTWGATIYPVPLAWGASFDSELVERMAAQIGASLRQVGVHQGLAPVLDVARDPRWGRTEETIGEDPYLVGTLGTAYVRGLQSAGIVATLKHFVGYSASRAGRNLAPVSVGARELADVLLPPFEMAVRDGAAESVMQAYNDNDGVPAAADHWLLTGLLRDQWGFGGTVVSDYFAVTFLRTLHGLAESSERAGALAIAAGVDVELPDVDCYGDHLAGAVRSGDVPEEVVDQAALRVLTQKCELGLLDPGWEPLPASDPGAGTGDGQSADARIDLDPPAHRDLAARLAEESVVLLANDQGTLPLAGEPRLAVVGPSADTTHAMLGCYSFPSHIGARYPDTPDGVRIPTLLDALGAEIPGARIDYQRGCDTDGTETSGIAAAVAAARSADVCVAVLGDRADLFGRGTSGEGCDREDLRLPGAQQQLLEAVLETGTPVVLVLFAGRPYALGGVADRLAAAVQAFFPGEEGGSAVAGVLAGRVNPSGRLPVAVPRAPGAQPASFIGPPLAHRSEVSSVDPTPLYPFGHGLSYTRFTWEDPRIEGHPAAGAEPAVAGTEEAVTLGCTVRNDGAVAGTEVVQLYLSDPVARVTRPPRRLVGYARVHLEPGAARYLEFVVHADLASYTAVPGRRIVEGGDLELALAASSADVRHTVKVRLEGPTRTVDHTRHLTSEVRVREPEESAMHLT
ncbi:beta-xylosidase [Lipingzhangella halophila]|uniref:Beta-xylosidase n=1 Tax=Lipingzhangella halophila TaxID=1783352 RepID=A0A7W7RM64_9ACTN|nr:glycoside hydrolase family 3 N-terminal domain-containing protein [Lipingzhangella halophila]MBB4934548.1 beta-xylosidase [Lipingzhangella halophila]